MTNEPTLTMAHRRRSPQPAQTGTAIAASVAGQTAITPIAFACEQLRQTIIQLRALDAPNEKPAGWSDLEAELYERRRVWEEAAIVSKAETPSEALLQLLIGWGREVSVCDAAVGNDDYRPGSLTPDIELSFKAICSIEAFLRGLGAALPKEVEDYYEMDLGSGTSGRDGLVYALGLAQAASESLPGQRSPITSVIAA